MSIPHCKRVFQRGQGMVEYALIILLVALATMAGLVLLGPTIEHVFSAVMPAL